MLLAPTGALCVFVSESSACACGVCVSRVCVCVWFVCVRVRACVRACVRLRYLQMLGCSASA
jgi:hypothetical protein